MLLGHKGIAVTSACAVVAVTGTSAQDTKDSVEYEIKFKYLNYNF